MKKKIRKCVLNTETIRHLQDEDLAKVVGGRRLPCPGTGILIPPPSGYCGFQAEGGTEDDSWGSDVNKVSVTKCHWPDKKSAPAPQLPQFAMGGQGRAC